MKKRNITPPRLLVSYALRNGGLNPDGSLNQAWVRDHSRGISRMARRARLWLSLLKMNGELVC